jgi:hypothetical protein
MSLVNVERLQEIARKDVCIIEVVANRQMVRLKTG